MKLTIEIELQPNMEQLLIDKINEYCQGWFNKKPVLHKAAPLLIYVLLLVYYFF